MEWISEKTIKHWKQKDVEGESIQRKITWNILVLQIVFGLWSCNKFCTICTSFEAWSAVIAKKSTKSKTKAQCWDQQTKNESFRHCWKFKSLDKTTNEESIKSVYVYIWTEKYQMLRTFIRPTSFCKSILPHFNMRFLKQRNRSEVYFTNWTLFVPPLLLQNFLLESKRHSQYTFLFVISFFWQFFLFIFFVLYRNWATQISFVAVILQILLHQTKRLPQIQNPRK